jgi:glycerol-3-phosphate dehydrogenase (NAD(P)+)
LFALDILSSMVMVAEGVPTLKAVKELAEKHGISMPIVTATYGIIYEGKSIKEALASLMGRELKEEFGK